jgi:hypothetical protein
LQCADEFYRYLGSMIKSEQGIKSEQQILSSETSGSTGGGPGQDSQMMSNLSRLPSLNWHNSMSTKIRPAPEPKVNSNLLHYHSPQMRGLLGQDFGLLPETSQVDVSGMQSASQQQQQAYVNNAYGGGAESVSVGRESEGQPLRHFFDDWPRSRDQSAMTWGSGVDDSERSNSDNLTHAPNNTQLSISIPITAPSSAALSAQHSSSPPAGTFSVSHTSWSFHGSRDKRGCSTQATADLGNNRITGGNNQQGYLMEQV